MFNDNTKMKEELILGIGELLNEDIPIYANVTIEEKDANTGIVLNKYETHNKVTSLWLTNLAKAIMKETYTFPDNIAVGTGTTAPAASDTALQTEKFRDAIAGKTRSGASITLTYTLATGNGNGNTLTEAGIFDGTGSSGGAGGFDPTPNAYPVYTTLAAGSTAGQIRNALAACPTGQAVILGVGTFNMDGGIIDIPAGKYLVGSLSGGALATHLNNSAYTGQARLNSYVKVGNQSVAKNLILDKSHIGDISAGNPQNFLIEDVTVNGISTWDGYVDHHFWFDWVSGNLQSATLNRCVSNNAATYGFQIHTTNRAMQANMNFTHCAAYNSGILAGQNQGAGAAYPCGFDFFEGMGNAEGGKWTGTVSDCIANGCLVDGFHIEYMQYAQATFDHCQADNNGKWLSYAHPADWSGCGFYIGAPNPASSIVFTNNKGTGNQGSFQRTGVNVLFTGVSPNWDETNHTFTNWNGSGSGPRSQSTAGSGGSLFMRATHAGIAKTASNTITYTWTISFAGN